MGFRSPLAAWMLVNTLVLVGSRPASAQPTPDTSGSTQPAGKDETSASTEIARGNASQRARQFDAAAQAYEEAFRRAPAPKTLFLAAEARRRNGDIAQAANEYARYLHDAPEG